MNKKILKISIGILRVACMTVLWPLEKILLNKSVKTPSPAVFIIGPPRSGTTLIYELMIRRYKFSYISNFAHKLYGTPVAATLIGKPIIEKWCKQCKSAYSSTYGGIKGWGAPSEGGWIWNRWLPENHYLDELHVKQLPAQLIKDTVNGIICVMNAPFINKNVMHSVHMRLLDKLFPNCLFIHIEREIKANIRSIVRAHAKVGKNEHEWFSVKPREWEQFKHTDILMRSAAQVHYTHKNIERDTKHLGITRVLKINYEEFCKAPQDTLTKIGEFMANNNVKFEHRDIVYPNLSTSKQKPFSEDIELQMSKYLESLLKNSNINKEQ